MTDDRARFDEIVRRHSSRVLGYLARRTDIAADAADVYQEVLLVTWRRLGRVPADEEGALAWLFATARRCLSSHRRGTVRRMAATERLAANITVHQTDSNDDVRTALSRLKADDRELLTLIYWEDLTSEQAAAALGISPAAARKRLERARRRVERELAAGAQPELPRQDDYQSHRALPAVSGRWDQS